MNTNFQINYRYSKSDEQVSIPFYGSFPGEDKLGALKTLCEIGKKVSEIVSTVRFSGVSDISNSENVPEQDPPYHVFSTLDEFTNEGAQLIADKIKAKLEEI